MSRGPFKPANGRRPMSVVDESTTFGRTRLSFASDAEIDEFVETLGRFERGELTPDQWRVFRLVRGTYGQRQTADAQMLRVKIPQGVLTAEQLTALADVGQRYSRGFAHDERFDVTPYAEALTRYLLRHPLSSTLPRKFKIAFEGCPVDHVATPINDLGFRAALSPDGRGRGFRVTAGGGTSILATSAALLHEFLPASELFRVAEAVLRVFRRLGDYQHKQRNRMKFLIRAIGWTRWREEYERELTACRLAGSVPTLDIDPPPSEPKPEGTSASSPSVGHIVSRVNQSAVLGPGLTPT